MKTPVYVCPTSATLLSLKSVRLTGFFMAALLALFVWLKTPVVLLIVLIDYFLRAFTKVKYSPASWIAHKLIPFIPIQDDTIDKAPKVFAAMVGFLFALTGMVFFFISTPFSLIFCVILMVFALLEALANICMGCLAYAFIFIHLIKYLK